MEILILVSRAVKNKPERLSFNEKLNKGKIALKSKRMSGREKGQSFTVLPYPLISHLCFPHFRKKKSFFHRTPGAFEFFV